jgi:hypothetical protein
MYSWRNIGINLVSNGFKTWRIVNIKGGLDIELINWSQSRCSSCGRYMTSYGNICSECSNRKSLNFSKVSVSSEDNVVSQSMLEIANNSNNVQDTKGSKEARNEVETGRKERCITSKTVLSNIQYRKNNNRIPIVSYVGCDSVDWSCV